jgi:hypothetical protein
VNLPSKESLTLEELEQAWEFLGHLLQRPNHPVEPPHHLRHLELEDWVLLHALLDRELEMKAHQGVH